MRCCPVLASCGGGDGYCQVPVVHVWRASVGYVLKPLSRRYIRLMCVQTCDSTTGGTRSRPPLRRVVLSSPCRLMLYSEWRLTFVSPFRTRLDSACIFYHPPLRFDFFCSSFPGRPCWCLYAPPLFKSPFSFPPPKILYCTRRVQRRILLVR